MKTQTIGIIAAITVLALWVSYLIFLIWLGWTGFAALADGNYASAAIRLGFLGLLSIASSGEVIKSK